MRLYKIIFLFTLSASGLFSGCTKTATGTVGPAGPQGPPGLNAQSKASAITGYVNLINQYGIPDSSFAGLTVSTKKGDSLLSSVTDPSGSFKLPGLTIGTYDLLFKKDGFDSLEVHVEHSGGDEDKFIGIVTVNEHVSTKILSETASFIQDALYIYDSILSLQLLINIDGPPLSLSSRRDFGFYYSRSSQVNVNQYDIFGNSYGYSLTSNTNTYTYQNNLGNLSNRGFNYHQGDTIYVKTYVIPVYNTVSSWFNYTTYQTISYPYFGDSALNYFIWP